MEVAEPLLKPQTSTLNHARPLTCVIFIFIFCLGIFGLTRKQIEEKLGLEEPGSNLPGCKVVSGKYTGQDADGVAKEISLGQKACIGRNIESGEKFRVFGNVIILGTDEKFGEIETNGNIKWTSGEIWVFDQSSIKKCATCGDAKAKAPAKTGPEGCVSVADFSTKNVTFCFAPIKNSMTMETWRLKLLLINKLVVLAPYLNL